MVGMIQHIPHIHEWHVFPYILCCALHFFTPMNQELVERLMQVIHC